MSWKRENVWLKANIEKCYFERVCIYLWQIFSRVIFVTIWLLIYCIHACPPYPYCQRLFTCSFQFSQVSIIIATCKKKPLVSRVNPPGICHNRFLYLLPKIFFRDFSKAVVTFLLAYNILYGRHYLNRKWRLLKSLLSLTTTRIFKMGDNFILTHRHSFWLVTQWGRNAWWSLRPVG